MPPPPLLPPPLLLLLLLLLLLQVHEERWRKAAEAVSSMGSGARVLDEVIMNEPIHYSRSDPLEKWALRTLGLPTDLDRYVM